MKPTEQLKNDHQAIKQMLKILEVICQRLEAKQKVSPEHLQKIIGFIKVFADQCHHHKEEDLLFPAMEQASMPREGGPIAVMLKEHNIGRNYVKGMSQAVAKKDNKNFIQNSRSYIELLDQHIDKEDNILYPMAEMHLTDKKQKELIQQFDKVEQEKIGPGKHEEFHRLINELKKIYLP